MRMSSRRRRRALQLADPVGGHEDEVSAAVAGQPGGALELVERHQVQRRGADGQDHEPRPGELHDHLSQPGHLRHPDLEEDGGARAQQRVEHGLEDVGLVALDVELQQVHAVDQVLHRHGVDGEHGPLAEVRHTLTASAEEGPGRERVAVLGRHRQLHRPDATTADSGGLHHLDVPEPVALDIAPHRGRRRRVGLDRPVATAGVRRGPLDGVVTDVRPQLEHIRGVRGGPPPVRRLGALVPVGAVPVEAFRHEAVRRLETDVREPTEGELLDRQAPVSADRHQRGQGAARSPTGFEAAVEIAEPAKTTGRGFDRAPRPPRPHALGVHDAHSRQLCSATERRDLAGRDPGGEEGVRARATEEAIGRAAGSHLPST
ncbi:MAG: hypothetical protein U5R31_14440 [Acidimicrobiia bacterium]|nr:hypothetical protein [Acidimicrobiia bacterium]